jgi:hypothetical protein
MFLSTLLAHIPEEHRSKIYYPTLILASFSAEQHKAFIHTKPMLLKAFESDDFSATEKVRILKDLMHADPDDPKAHTSTDTTSKQFDETLTRITAWFEKNLALSTQPPAFLPSSTPPSTQLLCKPVPTGSSPPRQQSYFLTFK